MNMLIDALKIFQANSIIFTDLVRGFFWNTESVLMRQSRIIYEEIYNNSEDAVNKTSNWLRRLGAEASYTIEDYAKYQTLGNVKPETYCGVEMAMHLVPINKKMIEDLKSLFVLASDNREYALATYLSERLEQHQEWNWFLESSLKLPPNPWKSLKD